MQIVTPFLSFFIPCAFCDFVTFWPLNHVDRRGRPNLVRRWNPKTWNAWKSRLLDWRKRRATRPALLVETFSQGLKAILSESWTRSPALYLRVSFLFFFASLIQQMENTCRRIVAEVSGGVTLPSAKAQDLAELSWAVKHFAELDVPFLFPGPSHRAVKALHTGKGAAKVWRSHRILMTFNVLLIPLVRVRASHHLSRRRAKAQFWMNLDSWSPAWTTCRLFMAAYLMVRFHLISIYILHYYI